jgi:hypothetical protein
LLYLKEDKTMPYLDAALAFALTMLAVSTLVTQIVRLGQNFFKLRNAGLKQMLAEYFTQELKPVVDRELSRLKTELTENVASGVSQKAQTLSVNLPFTSEELSRLTEVSTEELLERLKRSELGKDLLENLGNKAQTVFYELGNRYEIVGNKFSESFRNYSRLWTTVLALAAAFLLNIDSLYIADTYIKNEGMRQAVIAQKESLEDGYNFLSVKLQQDPTKDSITKAEFEQAFGDTKDQLDVFTSAGFPVGIAYFPHACFQNSAFSECAQRSYFFWFIGCVVTGLLAGLGAPFWYDAVTSLSRTIQTVRAEKKPETDV